METVNLLRRIATPALMWTGVAVILAGAGGGCLLSVAPVRAGIPFSSRLRQIILLISIYFFENIFNFS